MELVSYVIRQNVSRKEIVVCTCSTSGKINEGGCRDVTS